MVMRMSRSRALGTRIGLAVLLTALSGCSASPEREGSKEESTVKGTAKLHGKLMDAGVLHFNANNANRKVETRDATIGKDGTYTVQAFVGLNTVTISPPKTRNAKEGRVYFGLEYEEKTVIVKSGENTADFEFIP
jgi:hypothetical protein